MGYRPRVSTVSTLGILAPRLTWALMLTQTNIQLEAFQRTSFLHSTIPTIVMRSIAPRR
jgi:hypothetical protein